MIAFAALSHVYLHGLIFANFVVYLKRVQKAIGNMHAGSMQACTQIAGCIVQTEGFEVRAEQLVVILDFRLKCHIVGTTTNSVQQKKRIRKEKIRKKDREYDKADLLGLWRRSLTVVTSSSNRILEGRRKASRSCTLRFLPSDNWLTFQSCNNIK